MGGPRTLGPGARAAGAALLWTACAGPAPPAPPPPAPAAAPAAPRRDDLVVLLPGPRGSSGALAVTREGVTEILDQPYQAARVGDGGRLEVGRSEPAEVARIFGPALAAQPPGPMAYVLYFLEGRDVLTPESQDSLRSLLAEVAARPAPEVVVVGHTDRVGSVAFNDALSLQRAERVRAELLRLGVPAERVTVAGRGEREPLVPTDDEVAEPRNRRVEITVR